MKTYLLTEDRDTVSAKAIAKKNAKIISSSKFLSELQKNSSESVWVTDHPDILMLALQKPDIFELQNNLKKNTYLLVVGEEKASWESSLDSLFKKAFVFPEEASLPVSEVLEVFASKNPSALVIGGHVDVALNLLLLTRGDLKSLAIPLNTFSKSGDGLQPDFEQFSITDGGQTLAFGDYEASVDSILYEFDSSYRKQIKAQRNRTDKSFGACLRRLRIQKGLLQSEFGDVDEKAIGRIERGEITKPHRSTLNRIAKVLGVKPDEITSY